MIIMVKYMKIEEIASQTRYVSIIFVLFCWINIEYDTILQYAFCIYVVYAFCIYVIACVVVICRYIFFC